MPPPRWEGAALAVSPTPSPCRASVQLYLVVLRCVDLPEIFTHPFADNKKREMQTEARPSRAAQRPTKATPRRCCGILPRVSAALAPPATRTGPRTLTSPATTTLRESSFLWSGVHKNDSVFHLFLLDPPLLGLCRLLFGVRSAPRCVPRESSVAHDARVHLSTLCASIGVPINTLAVMGGAVFTPASCSCLSLSLSLSRRVHVSTS